MSLVTRIDIVMILDL